MSFYVPKHKKIINGLHKHQDVNKKEFNYLNFKHRFTETLFRRNLK